MNRTRVNVVVMWMGVALLATVSGCAFKGEGAASANASGGEARQGEVWEIRPVRMRIYPSSRFIREDGKPLLEARVEFFDAAGDSTKAVGEMRFELFTAGPAGQTTAGQRLYAWAVPMWTAEQNSLFYDSVTRTYLFRLSLDSLSIIRDQTRLRVILTPPRGPRIDTEALLTIERGVISLSPRDL
jgi:hypothetical protein